MALFVVERYVPAVLSPDAVSTGIPSARHVGIRHVRTWYLPEDETCSRCSRRRLRPP